MNTQSVAEHGRKTITLHCGFPLAAGQTLRVCYGREGPGPGPGREHVEANEVRFRRKVDGEVEVDLTSTGIADDDDEAPTYSMWVERLLRPGDSLCLIFQRGSVSFWELGEDAAWAYTGS